MSSKELRELFFKIFSIQNFKVDFINKKLYVTLTYYVTLASQVDSILSVEIGKVIKKDL